MPPKTYDGSCHCGKVKFTCALPEALAPEGTGKIGRCNCSICVKNGTGYFLVYPQAADVHFLDDSDKQMKSYLFRMKNKPHRFCPDCASNVLIDINQADDIPEMMKGKLAVNASLFKDIDLEKAEIYTMDGKNRAP
ncbi:hypothetical protein LTR35_007584 [Friedmanniomyces endolithicus]|nr:hypothetical protein LTR35_007584 [Friedmanniomyces endolithicus]KAK0295171.1 hypothetical protein LTS00_006228 [Friedmanniomyces endolithicus]